MTNDGIVRSPLPRDSIVGYQHEMIHTGEKSLR